MCFSPGQLVHSWHKPEQKIVASEATYHIHLTPSGVLEMAGYQIEESMQVELCAVCGDRASGNISRIVINNLATIVKVVITELSAARVVKDSSRGLSGSRWGTSAGGTRPVR